MKIDVQDSFGKVVESIKDELKKGEAVQGARLVQETRLDIK